MTTPVQYDAKTLRAEADPAYVSLMAKLRYIAKARPRVRRSSITEAEWRAAEEYLGIAFEGETHPAQVSGWTMVGDAQVVISQNKETGYRSAFRI